MVLLIASDGSAFKVLQISMNSLRVRRFCIVSYLEMNDWGRFSFSDSCFWVIPERFRCAMSQFMIFSSDVIFFYRLFFEMFLMESIKLQISSKISFYIFFLFLLTETLFKVYVSLCRNIH